MRRRHLFPLIWAAPALLLAVTASALVMGAAAGFLWIFVFGDDPWPGYAEVALSLMFGVGCVAIWAALLFLAYTLGKHEEGGTLQAMHVIAPIATTLALLLLIVAYEIGVGNMGVPP